MQNLPNNVVDVISKLLPLSVLDNVACFVFYDDHPAQRKHCDIIICTKHGEVKEYFKREEVSSLLLRSNFNATHIRIVRNNSCQLYYLVASDREVVILSKSNQLKVHQRVANVESYDVNDFGYNGLASLKIVQKDDAVPLIFDDKFQRLSDQAAFLNGAHVDDSIPILLDLKRKLVQTQYSVGCNIKSKEKLQDLRKLATFAAYQKINPSLEDSMFLQDYKQKYEAIKLQSKIPSVKICNQKFVIVLHAINKDKQDLKNVTVLLHVKNKPSIVYTTRLFKRNPVTPFWEETTQTLLCDVEMAMVVVVPLSELQFRVPRRMEFSGVISYERCDKECLMPFDYVVIPHVDTMGKEMDILANDIDEYSILALMATSVRVDLTLRVLSDLVEDTRVPLADLFQIYLGLHQMDKAKNILVHKKASHHYLNGVMVVLDWTDQSLYVHIMSVYARSPGQLVSFINYIYDAVPFPIVVTSTLYKITATAEGLTHFIEEMPYKTEYVKSFSNYAISIMKQMNMILQYLDRMMKMNSTKNAAMQSKKGSQIDLFANGVMDYMEFRTLLLKEALKGVQALKGGQFGTNEITQLLRSNINS